MTEHGIEPSKELHASYSNSPQSPASHVGFFRGLLDVLPNGLLDAKPRLGKVHVPLRLGISGHRVSGAAREASESVK